LASYPDLVVTGNDPIIRGVVSSGTAIITALESANGGAPIQVTDNLDSAGGFGTIPSSLVPGDTIVPAGNEITVTNAAWPRAVQLLHDRQLRIRSGQRQPDNRLRKRASTGV